MKPLDLSPEAIWRKRYRASNVLWAVLARQNPAHGLVCTNKDGIYQLYAWDVPSGGLTQITNQPAGMVIGLLSSDGNYIYFLKDRGGDEIGHFVRIPFSGGEPEDISPELPAYSSFSITQNHLGNVTGFLAAGEDGFKLYIKDGNETSRLLHHSPSLVQGPALSSDGKMAVIGSTARTQTLDFSLVALNTETGQ